MNDLDWVAIHATEHPADCRERALVLSAVSIPHHVVDDGTRSLLVVPAADEQRARHELYLYEQENRPARPRRLALLPASHDPWPGVLGFAVVVCLVAFLAGHGAFGESWLMAGRVDGVRLRDGEWWRLLTALTLHADVEHLVGNLVFGGFFGMLAGRVIGPGVTWLAVVCAAALANGVNTALLDPSHRSIGASTAVFAALGLVSGFVWRGRLMNQDRWALRLGPIVGGLALLAFTGSGDESTDVGAHLFGFACGMAAGMLLTRIAGRFTAPRTQLFAGLLALILPAAGWLVAFS